MCFYLISGPLIIHLLHSPHTFSVWHKNRLPCASHSKHIIYSALDFCESFFFFFLYNVPFEWLSFNKWQHKKSCRVSICLNKLVTKRKNFLTLMGLVCIEKQSTVLFYLQYVFSWCCKSHSFLTDWMLSCTWICFSVRWCPSSSRNDLVQLKKGGFFYSVRALFLVEFTNQSRSCYKKRIGDL